MKKRFVGVENPETGKWAEGEIKKKEVKKGG